MNEIGQSDASHFLDYANACMNWDVLLLQEKGALTADLEPSKVAVGSISGILGTIESSLKEKDKELGGPGGFSDPLQTVS